MPSRIKNEAYKSASSNLDNLWPTLSAITAAEANYPLLIFGHYHSFSIFEKAAQALVFFT